MPCLTLFWLGSPTKIDVLKKAGTLILTHWRTWKTESSNEGVQSDSSTKAECHVIFFQPRVWGLPPNAFMVSAATSWQLRCPVWGTLALKGCSLLVCIALIGLNLVFGHCPFLGCLLIDDVAFKKRVGCVALFWFAYAFRGGLNSTLHGVTLPFLV